MELSYSERLAHSTVRIECDLANGMKSTGTGFFYAFNKTDKEEVPAIITNKHVIRGAIKGRFILTLKDSSGRPQIGNKKTFEFDSFEKLWIKHPDPNIDLCIMPIVPFLSSAGNMNLNFFYVRLDETYLPTPDDISNMIGMENITMVGYPNGIWDSQNNLPIFRRGVLASNYKYDWNGKKEFLIDAACFPGSSGSPVLLFDIGGYQDRKGIFMGAIRMKLLGILYAGPRHTVVGGVEVVPIATQEKVISVATIPNNLGIVIKANQLLDFEKIIGDAIILPTEFKLL